MRFWKPVFVLVAALSGRVALQYREFRFDAGALPIPYAARIKPLSTAGPRTSPNTENRCRAAI